MKAEEKLDELMIDLPEPPIKPDDFSYITLNGKSLFVGGIIPFAEGGKTYTGRAGAEIRTDAVKQAARSAVLQAVSIIRKELGSLNKVRRIHRLEVFICSDPNFKDQRAVADSASQFINEIFGAIGKHSQMTIGVSSLPRSSVLTIALHGEIK